jgi:hypothetical protein
MPLAFQLHDQCVHPFIDWLRCTLQKKPPPCR